MNIWEFADKHSFIAFCMVLAVVFIVEYMFVYPYRAWNRLMRHLNIKKQGWPPPHCDADGDFKPEPKNEDEEE